MTARLAFLDARGAADRARVLADLSPATRELLDPPPDPGAWVPFAALVDLTRTIDATLGNGDLALAAETGRFAADTALASLRDALTSSGGPTFMFRQAASIWHQHYDSGTVVAGLLTPTTGRFRVEGFATPAWEHCESVRGWIERTLQLTGALDVVVEHGRCRTRGDDVCQYDCSWRLA